ncbi:hypothetical protein I3842_09G031500 [Carya illinoinensis]|uniref:Cotton fiber protein n=1 Tax=Carya illinoinensis TaxID=32201 RepID=A0A922DZW1_CARIL|nr:hypothetical protein I3842_09G031500 [Carya illinoinensis]
MGGPLPVFSLKSPSSTLSFTKIKTLIHTLIFSHVCRIIRALSKAKTIVIKIVKEIGQPIQFTYPTNKNKNKKLFFGSFRLHYNWCSSHVVPVPAPVLNGIPDTHLYYDSTWNSVLSTEQGEVDGGEAQLSGYLQWLDEKVQDDSTGDKDIINDVDQLAEMFIANCHEKFRLEKVESYRRFQEMMARSM